MPTLDALDLAQKLQTRFGLGLSGGVENIDGGAFVTIRPTDLLRPNGFCIVLARTPRQVEASFRADAFTRKLLRTLSESSIEAKNKFSTLAMNALSDGFRLSISVNENSILNPNDLPEGEWLKFELDCDKRIVGGKTPNEQLENLMLEAASTCLGLVLSLLSVEEITDTTHGAELGLPEGAQIKVIVNKYERSPSNRAACISYFGTICQVCNFDFGVQYGGLGQGFIEVHHLTPVSLMGGAYQINPIKDLVPVCCNCHSMLHSKNPPLTIDQLKFLITESTHC